MRADEEERCPHCGQAIKQQTEMQKSGAGKPAEQAAVERDRRGVKLPPRSPVGGIITPQ